MKVAAGLISLTLLLTPRTAQSSREWCHLIDGGPRGARRRRLRMVGGSGLRQPFTMAAGDTMFVGWVASPPPPRPQGADGILGTGDVPASSDGGSMSWRGHL
jgi:hypothetical protein